MATLFKNAKWQRVGVVVVFASTLALLSPSFRVVKIVENRNQIFSSIRFGFGSRIIKERYLDLLDMDGIRFKMGVFYAHVVANVHKSYNNLKYEYILIIVR